jgi:hypothetical protein
MSFIDRDVIMRQLRFLQQLLARVLKTQAEQDFPTALDQLHNGYREVLGISHDVLSRIDANSALLMLRTPERRQAYLELLRAEAEMQRAAGDPKAAESLARRVTQLERAAAS